MRVRLVYEVEAEDEDSAVRELYDVMEPLRAMEFGGDLDNEAVFKEIVICESV